MPVDGDGKLDSMQMLSLSEWIYRSFTPPDGCETLDDAAISQYAAQLYNAVNDPTALQGFDEVTPRCTALCVC